MPDIRVKICGLKTEADVAAVAASGAAYMGLVFFAKSPRHLTISEAKTLALAAPIGLAKVALTVNADDAALDAIVEAMPLDMLQLHGAETPERVAEVRARYGLPVMKAVGVADEGDLAALLEYSFVADQILVDAKPPKNADLPGGNGLSFDWRLVAQAIRLTNARQVDVSSGVEATPGVKDAARIHAFVKAATMDGPPILR